MDVLRNRSSRSRRAGFTLLELVISSALTVVLIGALVAAVDALRGLTNAGSARARLVEEGARALDVVRFDLTRSGFLFTNGKTYPYLFTDGAAFGDFADHAHAPTADAAEAGDPDFGPDREIVYVVPLDADGNGMPDLDVNGLPIFDPIECSIVIAIAPDGRRVLERRGPGGRRTLARDVERVVFDDPVSSGFTVPQNAIRVRIFMRTTDENGALQRHVAEATVRLRNG
jgi:hypothetical protein